MLRTSSSQMLVCWLRHYQHDIYGPMSDPSGPQHPHSAISPNPMNFLKNLGRHFTSAVTYFME